MKRYAHRLNHSVTGTAKMGFCYPATLFETFPGDSFNLQIENLTRFLAQVAPTMHEVNLGIDVYSLPLRQLCDKIGISWDDLLTGGEDGNSNITIPQITIPEHGYQPGSLADWLGYPTNYEENGSDVVVGAGLQLSALPVIAYMHVINENYRDQNFIKKLDLTKYQEFLDGTYQFETPSGEPIDYELCEMGLFPKAWNRDYFGRALPNTQRGQAVSVPMGTTGLSPTKAPVVTGAVLQGSFAAQGYTVPAVSIHSVNSIVTTDYSFPAVNIPGVVFQDGSVLVDGFTVPYVSTYPSDPSGVLNGRYIAVVSGTTLKIMPQVQSHGVWSDVRSDSSTSFPVTVTPATPFSVPSGVYSITSYTSYADLQAVQNTGSIELLAFRLAARMQRFGEVLQQSGARAVEFTLAMFGVRVPDERIQRPTFHGSWRLPVVFSEVLQTSQTTQTSPQGNLAGHGITGGVNRPIHIKCVEHGFVIAIMHVMPKSQFRNITPRYLLRKTRWDIPNPIFQNVGEQAIKRVEIFPNSAHPDEAFGYVPHYSELGHIPSTLHGHMKDTFLHWNMARAYSTEPVLSAAWRYERPTDRSFSVLDESQLQLTLGFKIKARRPFQRNPQPGIHIV